MRRAAATFAASHAGVYYRCTSSWFGNVRDAISGEGALFSAGRYHAKGAFRAVYLASALDLAHEEYFHTAANIGFAPSDLLPITTLAVEVSLHSVLDLSRADVCQALGTTPAYLATYDWSKTRRGEPFTQKLGRLAQAEGLDALLFPSAAAIVTPSPVVQGLNLVVFPDNLRRNPANVFQIQNSDKLPAPPVP